MDKLILKNVRQLENREFPIYFTISRFKDIKKWSRYPKFQDSLEHAVTIVSSDIKVISENCIEVFDPIIKTPSLEGANESEWPVLIFSTTTSYIVIQMLTHEDVMGLMIETRKNVSENSTKMITYHALEEIVDELFNSVPLYCSVKLSDALSKYIKELKSRYSYLDYLSVKERKKFRSESVADKKFAWYLYLRYFLEQWTFNKDIKIPPLNKTFSIENWSGHFFQRVNPLWNKIYKGEKRKHNPSKQQRKRIYEIWKSFIEES